MSADATPTFTEIWEIDPDTGDRVLVARFDRLLEAAEAVDLAVAHALSDVEHLTVGDLFPPAA